MLLLTPPVDAGEALGSFSGVENNVAPLGICYLAASLRKRGYGVSIIDATTFKMPSRKVLQAVLQEAPDYIGITATSPAIPSAADIAAQLKGNGVRAPIIIGGVHVTNKPFETLDAYPAFDIGVLGDGEEVLPAILDCLREGRSPASLKGVASRQNGRTIVSEGINVVRDLDALPLPAWDLLCDFPRAYRPAPQYFYRLPSATLVTSRGCPGKCIFCAKSINRRKVASHSASSVIGMIEHLMSRYGVRDIFFFDDTFLFSRKRAIEICTSMIERRLPVSWCCFCRGGEVDPELLGLMKRSGCYQVSIGVESGDQRILDILGKNIPLEKTIESIRFIHGAGIRVHGFFIIGSPGETEESIRRTMALIRHSPFSSIQLSYFSPLPGTAAEEMVAAYGRIRSDVIASNLWEPVFIPRDLDVRRMEQYYRKILRGFFFSPRRLLIYCFRVLTHPRHLSAYARAAMAILRRLLSGKAADFRHLPPAPGEERDSRRP
ncbi:MAG: radical SAM protein [bacterium]|nr:radical SAM protein [bacterium]